MSQHLVHVLCVKNIRPIINFICRWFSDGIVGDVVGRAREGRGASQESWRYKLEACRPCDRVPLACEELNSDSCCWSCRPFVPLVTAKAKMYLYTYEIYILYT